MENIDPNMFGIKFHHKLNWRILYIAPKILYLNSFILFSCPILVTCNDISDEKC